MNRFRQPMVASFAAVVLIAQAGIAEAAGESRQVAAATAASPPAHVAKASGGGVDAQCEALRQNPDDPSLACEAVRCATGQDAYWSRCTASGTEHEPLPVK